MVIMKNLYNDLSAAKMALKHFPSNVDPNEIRDLISRTISLVDTLSCFSYYNSLNIEKKEVDGYIENEVTIKVTLTREQLEDLLLYLSGNWDNADDF